MKSRGPKLPWVRTPDVSRLPRDPSYGAERDAGRVLIALIHDFGYFHSRPIRRVVVRNCYRHNERGMMVENMREFRPSKTRGTSVSFKTLATLKKPFEIYRKPFLLQEPAPNYQWEGSPEAFEQAWADRQYKPLSQVASPHTAEDLEVTPTLRLIRLHWQAKRLHQTWTPERVTRLAALWGLTIYELAALIQMPAGQMERFVKRGDDETVVCLPSPVMTWFEMMEATKLGLNVFPELPAIVHERKTA